VHETGVYRSRSPPFKTPGNFLKKKIHSKAATDPLSTEQQPFSL
jgi:hypothetical protein